MTDNIELVFEPREGSASSSPTSYISRSMFALSISVDSVWAWKLLGVADAMRFEWRNLSCARQLLW